MTLTRSAQPDISQAFTELFHQNEKKLTALIELLKTQNKMTEAYFRILLSSTAPENKIKEKQKIIASHFRNRLSKFSQLEAEYKLPASQQTRYHSTVLQLLPEMLCQLIAFLDENAAGGMINVALEEEKAEEPKPSVNDSTQKVSTALKQNHASNSRYKFLYFSRYGTMDNIINYLNHLLVIDHPVLMELFQHVVNLITKEKKPFAKGLVAASVIFLEFIKQKRAKLNSADVCRVLLAAAKFNYSFLFKEIMNQTKIAPETLIITTRKDGTEYKTSFTQEAIKHHAYKVLDVIVQSESYQKEPMIQHADCRNPRDLGFLFINRLVEPFELICTNQQLLQAFKHVDLEEKKVEEFQAILKRAALQKPAIKKNCRDLYNQFIENDMVLILPPTTTTDELLESIIDKERHLENNLLNNEIKSLRIMKLSFARLMCQIFKSYENYQPNVQAIQEQRSPSPRKCTIS